MSASFYDLMKLPIRNQYVRIRVFDSTDTIMGDIEGLAISGTLNLSGNSPYRRLGSVVFSLTDDSNLLPNKQGRIWFNHRIQFFIGLYDYVNDKIRWFPQGIFWIDEISISKNSNDRTISCELKDSMVYLDGTFQGVWKDNVLIESSGATIREAVIATVNHYVEYYDLIEPIVIDGVEETIPYNLHQAPNSTRFDTIKMLTDLYKGYEFFFDRNGYFVMRRIKDRRYDPIVWDFSASDSNIAISYVRNFSFSSIKNSVHIIGRQLDNGQLIKWSYRNRWFKSFYSQIAALTASAEVGDICTIETEGKSYVFTDSSTWVETDFYVNPYFSMDRIGERERVINNDKIQTVGQAMLNAEYELSFNRSFAERVSISSAPIYTMQPNQKIRVIENDIGMVGEFLIEQISMPLSSEGLMSIEAVKINY